MEYDSNFLKSTKKFLVLLGTWPLHVSPFGDLAYKIYGNVILSFYTIFVASLIGGVKDIIYETPEKQAYVLQYDFTYTFVLWKMLLSQKSSVRKLMKIISKKEREILNSNDEGLKNVYKHCLGYNATVFKIFFCGFAVIIFLFAAVTFSEIQSWPTVDLGSNSSVSGRKLPLPQTLPFQNYIGFDVQFGFQVSGRLMGGFIFPGCDTLFMSLVYFPAAHLKVLRYKFKHFGDKVEDDRIGTEMFLKSLVMEHKEVIDYVIDLNEILKWILSIDFLLQSYHITLALMEIMTLIANPVFDINFVVTLCLSVTYLTVTFLQMCCLYYNSNEVVIESMELANGIFHSNWYEQSPSVKCSFIIIINRSQKPLELKIGNLYTITNDLIVKFVKAGLTYVLLSRLDSQYI